MQSMSSKTNTMTRLLVYSALAVTLWLRFRATTSLQTTIMTIVCMLALITVNYYGARLLIDYLTSSKAPRLRLVARSTSVLFLIIGASGICLCDMEFVAAITSFIRGLSGSADRFGFAWLSGFIGTLFAWVGAYELRITDDKIDYFSFLTGARSLHRRDIDHARVRVGWFTYSDRFRPTNRLEMLPISSASLKPIIVNLKAFRRSDLDVVFEWLGDKLKDG
jgi:hypothetical protein